MVTMINRSEKCETHTQRKKENLKLQSLVFRYKQTLETLAPKLWVSPTAHVIVRPAGVPMV